MPQWILRHPYSVGAFFAVLTAFGAFNAYRAGLAVGQASLFGDDAARLRSESLGG